MAKTSLQQGWTPIPGGCDGAGSADSCSDITTSTWEVPSTIPQGGYRRPRVALPRLTLLLLRTGNCCFTTVIFLTSSNWPCFIHWCSAGSCTDGIHSSCRNQRIKNEWKLPYLACTDGYCACHVTRTCHARKFAASWSFLTSKHSTADLVFVPMHRQFAVQTKGCGVC